MPDPTPAAPTPTADQKRIALDSFNRAKEAITSGNPDYAITLLLTCCKLDPANFLYRQTLRKTQKEKYGNNLRGSRFAFLSTPRWKAKVKAAKRSRDYLKVLEHGEQVLSRNPWDMGTQMDMAEAFDALGLGDLAIFSLDQARQKFPRDATLNRALARLFEKRGDFQKAIVLWQLVKEKNPTDVEAAHKAKDLAASETIQKAAKEVVAKLTTGDYLARVNSAAVPAGGVEGKIIKVEGTKAWINLGSSSGIKMGDNFKIFNVGEALIDPDTGAKLGADEKQTGNGFVVEVQDKYAIVQFTGKAAAKDTIRK